METPSTNIEAVFVKKLKIVPEKGLISLKNLMSVLAHHLLFKIVKLGAQQQNFDCAHFYLNRIYLELTKKVNSKK